MSLANIEGFLDKPASDALYPSLSNKTTIAVGSGSRTLTAAEIAGGNLIFSGTLTANETYTFPATNAREIQVENQTSGAFTLSLKRGIGGTAHALRLDEIIKVRI